MKVQTKTIEARLMTSQAWVQPEEIWLKFAECKEKAKIL
jgi:hypothetical protein